MLFDFTAFEKNKGNAARGAIDVVLNTTSKSKGNILSHNQVAKPALVFVV